MMDWRAPERVGEHVGFSGEDLSIFLSIVRDVHAEQMDAEGEHYDLSKEYFKFLNNEVFSNPEVISHLRESGISEDAVIAFQQGSVDIESAFETYYKFQYRLDELVDFIMMIKLVRDYLEYTGREHLAPTDRLHYLAYLTNNELKETSVEVFRNQRTDLGMLEFTGYRYTFRKRSKGPYSSRLARDKDRLFAWDVFEKEVDDEYDPNEFRPFQLQLGHSGRMLTMRHETKFDTMRTAESHLLREWVFAQRNVLERFADLPIEELRNHVTSINDYSTTIDGRVLLTGRPRFFDPEEEGILTSIAGGIQHA